jgi:N-acetylglucosamine-6-phosphate deacetylase
VRLGVAAALVGRELVPGDVELADGQVARVGVAPRNGRGRGIASPGFVDLQVNGFAGVDFASADAADYGRAGTALLEHGVTAYLPTLITMPEPVLLAALEAVPADAAGARIVGVHVEGPFIAPERLGVHPASARRDPDPLLLERILAAGPVRVVTLAPELPGALDLIELLHARGVVVSLGHTDATAEEAAPAFDLGVRTVTHLFNAMRPFHHRDPGIAGAALARGDVVVQLVLDGNHLAPDAVRMIWEAARGRVALVTDAMAGAGNGDGSYRLAGIDVEVREGLALRADGVLAGSVLTMVEAVRNLHSLGVPLEDALHAGTAVPARVAGCRGVLEPGAPADLVILDDNLEVERVLLGGEARVAA